MDAAKAIIEINDLDLGMKNKDKDVIYQVMERCGATQEEVQKAVYIFSEFGFNLSQIDRNTLKILLSQYLITEMRNGFIAESISQSGEIISQARSVHTEHLAQVHGEIKNLSDEVLTSADHMFTKTRNQAVEVSKLIADLDPKGDLVGQFAGSVLQGVSQGIQAQANTFNAGMNQALHEHINRIALENAVLKNQLVEVSGEVKKLQALKVQDLVSPLSHELTLQMSTVTERATSYFSDLTTHSRMVVEKLSKDLEAQANSVFKKLTDRNQQAQIVYDLNANAAANKFEEVVQSAEVEFVKLVVQVERTIGDRNWIERFKIWGGVAVIAVLASGLTNYLLFFRFFKY